MRRPDLETEILPSLLSAALSERRSVRRFDKDAVDTALIIGLIEKALWAPSPHNSQPWRFTVLTIESKRRLAIDMAGALREDLLDQGTAAEIIDSQTERSRDRISEAPGAILCSIAADGLRLCGDRRLDELELQMAVQSVGAVLQTFFLVAAEAGLGTCWMAAPMYCPSVVRKSLGLADNYQPQALVLLGKPAQPGRVRPRRPIESVIQVR